MSVCSTCRGYGLARGGLCWTCKGGGSEPAADGFKGHLVTQKEGGSSVFYPAGVEFSLASSSSVEPLYAHPSPTPAADADRVRIAKDIEKAMESVSTIENRAFMQGLDRSILQRHAEHAGIFLRSALTALKSEAK